MPRRQCELGTVLLEPALEFIGGRLVGGGHVLGEELHFYAMRRLTISSFLSRLIAIGLTVEHLGLHLLLHHAVAS